MFLKIQSLIVSIVTAFLYISGSFVGVNHNDTKKLYIKAADSVAIYDNTIETAVPQTEIYNIITNHFNSALPEGKLKKKAIVIGYDGCRLDALSLMKDNETSAITSLMNEGGQAVVSYCGGKNFPAINTQSTSTAPGWCSMLTGQWADVHGITGNGIPKSNEHLTLLTTLVESGEIDSSAFYVSWSGHFNSERATYWNEKNYIKDNGINSQFVCAENDDGTYGNVAADLAKQDCSDFIFSIFEYCDHEGHSSGFCIRNPKYAENFKNAEITGQNIIDDIKARPTYSQEDWLIIITSDHGGYDLAHGSMTIQERMTFIITNKKYDYKFTADSGSEPFC